MKELLVQLASYNVWANKLLTDAVLSLSEEQQYQQLESSFPTLYATIMHMWIAESI
ncbi:MAG: DinB family protein, partial [Chitinophagaceae bacterium]